MANLVLPQDIVLTVQSWLKSLLPPEVEVVKRRPNPMEGFVVTLRRIGGAFLDEVTDGPWVTADVYGETDFATAELAHMVWAGLFAIKGQYVDGVQCYNVSTIAGPADQYDRQAELHHWSMTMQIAVRARAV